MLRKFKRFKRLFSTISVILSLSVPVMGLQSCASSATPTSAVNANSTLPVQLLEVKVDDNPKRDEIISITLNAGPAKESVQGRAVVKIKDKTFYGSYFNLSDSANNLLNTKANLNTISVQGGDSLNIEGYIETLVTPSGATSNTSNTIPKSITVAGTATDGKNPPNIKSIYFDESEFVANKSYKVNVEIDQQASFDYVNETRINCGTGGDKVVNTGNSGDDHSGQIYTSTCVFPRAGSFTVGSYNTIPAGEDLPSNIKSRNGQKRTVTVIVSEAIKPTPQATATAVSTPAPTATASNASCQLGQVMTIYGCRDLPSPTPTAIANNPTPAATATPLCAPGTHAEGQWCVANPTPAPTATSAATPNPAPTATATAMATPQPTATATAAPQTIDLALSGSRVYVRVAVNGNNRMIVRPNNLSDMCNSTSDNRVLRSANTVPYNGGNYYYYDLPSGTAVVINFTSTETGFNGEWWVPNGVSGFGTRNVCNGTWFTP